MQQTERTLLDELRCYFVVKQAMPDGSSQVTFSSYAPFRDDQTSMPFDAEVDAALYLLEEVRNGAIASSNDEEIARAIIRGDRPMFLYEEKQPDGRLLLSLHDDLPPEGSPVTVFGSRSPRLVARLLLRRLHESKRVYAIEETIEQAQALMG
ncbi:MAG TPA: hypothetical protein VHZ51_18605 [Ktedonobacteraceae bacterium]|jgi:hypothetical protein|nr:hypothetical protein [Ktedonobacteraceae bacterium]